MLSRKDRSKFQDKIGAFTDSLASGEKNEPGNGVELYDDFSCCQSCGHYEMESRLIEDGYDPEKTSYLFYHQQEGNRLREGADEVYFAHDIKEKDVAFVMEVVKGYGGSWNGSPNTTICIPFIDFTPEKRKEMEEEEIIRARRIALLAKLKEEGASREVIDEWLKKAEYCFNVPSVFTPVELNEMDDTASE